VIAHVPFITEDYVDRHKAIGGGLSLTGWRYLAGTATNNGPPFRMIVDNGIPTGMSSDGMQIAPMNPWIHMYYATTGRNARGDLINDGQQISRAEVLRLYTASNGWFLREEDDLGTIEPGKHADLVVLDRDYFAVPDEDLRKVTSVLTIVGGDVVHDTGVVRVD
jgi:predicted amidohydrolase YtcJ